MKKYVAVAVLLYLKSGTLCTLTLSFYGKKAAKRMRDFQECNKQKIVSFKITEP